jgi:hypothetical protein
MAVLNDTRWPSRQDRLFTGDAEGDPMANACVNFVYWDRVYPYALGYKQAGEIVLKYVLDQQSEQDSLVYPIVFLFRHHVELMLKETTGLAARLVGDHSGFPHGHDLRHLWAQCRARLEAACGYETELDVVERLVKQLASEDPQSDSFRYHLDGHDQPTLARVTHINLRHFADVMDGLTNFLDACHTQLIEEERLKQESGQY